MATRKAVGERGITLAFPPTPRSNGASRVPRSTPYDFLDTLHPIYIANQRRWAINEARLYGGDAVLPELVPFDYETDRTVTGQYYMRQQQAIYLNFPDIFTTGITGQLLRFAPRVGQALSFGALGDVGMTPNWSSPTRAEQVYYSADKPGGSGKGWDQFWMDEAKWAMATGHRWLYCDTPTPLPFTFVNRQAEISGFRPYLVGFSPLDVTNWYINQLDQLEYAVIRYTDYKAQFIGAGITVGGMYRWYLLLVRAGNTTFGPEYAQGGWWRFSPDKEPMGSGTWDSDTAGEIPMWPLFYEAAAGTKDLPAMSRPGITELGQAAIAYMNIVSSGNFNAWDAGKGIEWLAGVDEDGMDLANSSLKRGDRYIPLPPNQDTDATPQVFHSAAGQTSSQTFTDREKAISFVATQLGMGEAFGQTQSRGTGATQSADFTKTQVPRIVKAAFNLETAQRRGLYWLARRFGVTPDGSIQWPRSFDLVEVMDAIQSFFTVERLSGIRSATIDAKAMTMYAVEKRLISTDEEQKTVLKEYEESAFQRDQLAQAQADQLASRVLNSNLPPSGQTPGGQDTLNQPGSIGGPPKAGASQAKDRAREAGKKADKSTAKRKSKIPRQGKV